MVARFFVFETNLKIYLKSIKILIPIFFTRFIALETSEKKLNGFKYKYYLQDLLSVNSIGKSKLWEPHILKFSQMYLSEFNDKNILDIGAHIGYHSMNFATLTKGKVYSFEPQPQNYKLLHLNAKINNLKNIHPIMMSLSDINESSKIPLVSKSKDKGNMGDFTINNLTSNMYAKINSRTLDSFNLENIALIKIDVQGWEKKVLKGAEETLKRCKPLLIIEFENHQLLKTNTSVEELIAYIKQLDYYIFYLDYSYPSDHVCVHKSEIDYFRSKFKKYIYEHTEDNPINNNLKLGIFEQIKFNLF